MSELIKRSEVLQRLCAACSNMGSFACMSCNIPGIIKGIPKIEAQPMHRAHWIPVDGEPYAKCSYCGEKHYGCATPYCDMCGSYMKKDGANNVVE